MDLRIGGLMIFPHITRDGANEFLSREKIRSPHHRAIALRYFIFAFQANETIATKSRIKIDIMKKLKMNFLDFPSFASCPSW